MVAQQSGIVKATVTHKTAGTMSPIGSIVGHQWIQQK